MLSIQILEHTYAPGMEIPIPELPSLGRHIYHRCVSLYAEHTIIGPHLWPTYGDSYTRIALVGSTYISQMRQSLCWAYNYWNTPMTHLWRSLYPNCPRWVDIYITDASVSMLSIQILEHTCAPGMEIPIPELPSLGRHIYHRCISLYDEQICIGTHLCPSYGDSYTRISVSLSAEHTTLGTHLCPMYWDSYTRITILVPTYISQMRQSQCWAYNDWNTPMPQRWRFLYPNYRHWVDIYITAAPASMLSIQLLKDTYVSAMEIPLPVIPSLGRNIYHWWVSLYAEHKNIGTHLCSRYGDSYTRITVIGSTYISQMRQSLCWAYNNWTTPMTHLWRFLYPNCPRWVDIYITDASVSMLSIQLLEHTYDPPMEIPIPELPSLGRHIYHRCVSLYAEHTNIGTHLCSGYGDSYTRITVIGSTYISQMRQSLCWAYSYWNTPVLRVWKFLYPNYRHWVDIYITDASVSMLSIQ